MHFQVILLRISLEIDEISSDEIPYEKHSISKFAKMVFNLPTLVEMNFNFNPFLF